MKPAPWKDTMFKDHAGHVKFFEDSMEILCIGNKEVRE